eukprot:3275476-Rhodomonas_salina.2
MVVVLEDDDDDDDGDRDPAANRRDAPELTSPHALSPPLSPSLSPSLPLTLSPSHPLSLSPSLPLALPPHLSPFLPPCLSVRLSLIVLPQTENKALEAQAAAEREAAAGTLPFASAVLPCTLIGALTQPSYADNAAAEFCSI